MANLAAFLAHVMVYGSSADVAVTRRYVPAEEFRQVLENAPAGLFTKEVWQRWREQLGMPLQPCRGDDFAMAHWVPSQAGSLVGSGSDQSTSIREMLAGPRGLKSHC